jgi:acyl carrier protein
VARDSELSDLRVGTAVFHLAQRRAPSHSEVSVVEGQIRSILAEYGQLGVPVDQLDDQAELYRAGLTSHASVNLMLALEDHFGIEFPERLLRRKTFETISSIAGAIEELIRPNAPVA